MIWEEGKKNNHAERKRNHACRGDLGKKERFIILFLLTWKGDLGRKKEGKKNNHTERKRNNTLRVDLGKKERLSD